MKKNKLYEVWTEGFAATGENGTAMFHGTTNAESFEKACEALLGDSLYKYDDGKLTVWGCACYDNEADARKYFG